MYEYVYWFLIDCTYVCMYEWMNVLKQYKPIWAICKTEISNCHAKYSADCAIQQAIADCTDEWNT